jgi:hypothetical protein
MAGYGSLLLENLDYDETATVAKNSNTAVYLKWRGLQAAIVAELLTFSDESRAGAVASTRAPVSWIRVTAATWFLCRPF